MCEVGSGADVERAIEQCDPSPLEMSAKLDGKELVIKRETSEGSFLFEAGPASMIATSNARFQAVAGGEWVGPMTLAPGEHLLQFDARSVDFELDVTYELIVK